MRRTRDAWDQRAVLILRFLDAYNVSPLWKNGKFYGIIVIDGIDALLVIDDVVKERTGMASTIRYTII